jgi:hypothetical protein
LIDQAALRFSEGWEMKRLGLWIVVFLFSCPISATGSEDFLGVPLVSSGKVLVKTESRLEMLSTFSHDQVVNFYRSALKDLPDIKFRDWKDAIYIEDDGNLGWHSITVSKGFKGGTQIVIVKDNWTWIIGTLILRFVGVFVVLLVLFLGMSFSGAIISRAMKKPEEMKK